MLKTKHRAVANILFWEAVLQKKVKEFFVFTALHHPVFLDQTVGHNAKIIDVNHSGDP